MTTIPYSNCQRIALINARVDENLHKTYGYVDTSKELVEELKRALTTSHINTSMILSLRTKIEYIIPLEQAKQAEIEKLKFAGKLIVFGSHDPLSILSSFPIDIFIFISRINLEIFERTSAELLDFNIKYTDEVEKLEKKIAIRTSSTMSTRLDKLAYSFAFSRLI
jgi:hypothetical protein